MYKKQLSANFSFNGLLNIYFISFSEGFKSCKEFFLQVFKKSCRTSEKNWYLLIIKSFVPKIIRTYVKNILLYGIKIKL